MNRKTLSLLSGFAILLLIGIAPPLHAKTADGETPAEETVCDPLSGAAFGLCNAYCEAMDCELLDDGDPLTEPNASEKACLRIKDNFIKLTGEGALPCECPSENGQFGCACIDNHDCADGMSCDAGICIEDEEDSDGV